MLSLENQHYNFKNAADKYIYIYTYVDSLLLSFLLLKKKKKTNKKHHKTLL